MPEDIGSVAIAEPVDAAEVVDSNTETVEAPNEGADTGDTQETGEETQQTDADKVSTGKISLKDAARKHAAALKAIDPHLASEIQSAAFRLGGFEKEFPGGLKEARTLKGALDEFGGVEGMREAQQAISDYSKMEEMFEKSDPQFFNSLAEESPEAFSTLMPAGLEKWKSVDPDNYNHTLAQVMVQTLDSARFSSTLESIFDRLGDSAENKPLRDAIASMWQTVDGYRKVAAQAPEKKVAPAEAALTKREQAIAEREQKAFLAPIATSGKQHVTQIVDAEMGRGYQWAQTSADVQDAVRERVTQEIVKASKADKTFMRDFDRFRSRNDGAGLERHIKNFQQRVGPGIVEKVARLFNVKPKGAGAGPVKVQPQAQRANGAQRIGTTDWERITRQPGPGEWDRVKTTADMILEQRAILKSGKRVTWG